MADAPLAPAPVRERGYTNEESASSFWYRTARERTPELRWPKSIEVYEAMSDQDSQVTSVLSAVIMPILRTTWRIDGTGCRPEVTAHIAEDLGLPIVGQGNQIPQARTRGRFSWSEHLATALEDMLVFGHSYFEQVYRIEESGLAHIRKLGYRPPQTIAKFNVARDGGLVSIEQRGTMGTTGTVTLPVSRLVAYVHRRKGGNWLGRSLLRSAYKNWLLKDRLLRVQTQSIERNGMGIPKYTAAPEEKSLDKGRELASSVRAGDNAGVALDHDADLELMGVTGTIPDADAPIRYHDEQIARAVLAHFLNLGSTPTGSRALGSTFADFFTLSIQYFAELVRETGDQHIIEDLVDINWGPNEPAPRLVFDEIGARADSIVQAIAILVSAEVLKPDEDLEEFVRTALGLPPRHQEAS